MPKSKKIKKMDDLPPDLQREIVDTGNAMRQFYGMPTDQRQETLNDVSRINEKLDELNQ